MVVWTDDGCRPECATSDSCFAAVEIGKGKLVLPETGKVIVSLDEEIELKGEAEILVQDLKEMFGWEYSVVIGKKEKGAVYLTLGKPDKILGEEGYRMNIQGEVTIEAPTSKGVFWGTRTLLQMLHNQPEGLMKGRATDFPLYPNRGFMIDVGRKFFTMDYLRDYVKILSFYKMNELQVHLNDNGFVEFLTMTGTKRMQLSVWKVNVFRG